MGLDNYLNLISDFVESPAVARRDAPLAANTEDFAAHCDELWSWRSACNPILLGGVFAALLVLALLVARRIRTRRERRVLQAQSQELAGSLKDRRVTVQKPEPQKIDRPFHVEANTMSLDQKRLVKTGTPYDKGVMG